MKLGGSSTKNQLLESLKAEGELIVEEPAYGAAPGAGAARAGPPVPSDPISIVIEEKLSVVLRKDGGMENLEVQGTMALMVQKDEDAYIRVLVRRPRVQPTLLAISFPSWPRDLETCWKQKNGSSLSSIVREAHMDSVCLLEKQRAVLIISRNHVLSLSIHVFGCLSLWRTLPGPQGLVLEHHLQEKCNLPAVCGYHMLEASHTLACLLHMLKSSHALAWLWQLESGENRGFQFKTHPNIDKALHQKQNALGLKDPSKPFPTGNQPLGILKWRMQSKNEEMVPLSSECSLEHQQKRVFHWVTLQSWFAIAKKGG